LKSLLLDSHTVLWTLYEPVKLGMGSRDAIRNPDNSLFVSLATIWELSNKAGVGRLPLVSSVETMIGRIHDLGASIVPITQADIVAAQKLPHHHADPFDRMLIAQARGLSLTLVTKDSKIALYEVDILWA